ncbi:hypothetical protein T484DRAFT_1878250 [Baffinella frigidus]|nr:hypothetical protein T484DRAFT_1878250 [Cryptophyta sp. CCMP2293]
MMRVVLAFALAACIAPSVDGFVGTTPALRNTGRSLAGNLCMTADDQQLSRRNILSSAVAAAVSLTAASPAWAQPVAGRPKYTKAQDKGKAAKAAQLAGVPSSELSLQQQACEKFPVSLSPTCQALEAEAKEAKNPAPATPVSYAAPTATPTSVAPPTSAPKEDGGIFGFKMPELKLPEIKLPSVDDLTSKITGEKPAAPAAPKPAAGIGGADDDE